MISDLIRLGDQVRDLKHALGVFGDILRPQDINMLGYLKGFEPFQKWVNTSLCTLNQTLSNQEAKMLDHLEGFESYQKWVNSSLVSLSQNHLVTQERLQHLETLEQHVLLVWTLVKIIAVLILLHAAFYQLIR